MMKTNLLMLALGALALTACGESAEVAETETVADGVEVAGGPSETMPATAPGADVLGPAATTATAWDNNNNGLFEQTEYGAYGDSSFNRWDANNDNRLDRAEFDKNWTTAGWRDSGTAWGAFDDNNDGFLDNNEFFGDDEFGTWDRNRSGILESDEWFGV